MPGFCLCPLFIHFFFFHFFFLSFFLLLIMQGLIAVLFLSVHQLRSRLVQIHNTLSARPCKERSEAEKRKFSKEMEVRDPLRAETRIHCAWQQKLVHFINDNQTQKGREWVDAAEPSNVSLRQCWAPVHLAPAHSPSSQRLPFCPGRPSPITDEFGLIQLILPLSLRTPRVSWLPSFDPELQ